MPEPAAGHHLAVAVVAPGQAQGRLGRVNRRGEVAVQVGQAPGEGGAGLEHQPRLIGSDGGIDRGGGRSGAPGRLADPDVGVAIGRAPDRAGGVAAQRVEGKGGGGARAWRGEPDQPVAEVVAIGGVLVEGDGRAGQVAVGIVGEAVYSFREDLVVLLDKGVKAFRECAGEHRQLIAYCNGAGPTRRAPEPRAQWLVGEASAFERLEEVKAHLISVQHVIAAWAGTFDCPTH
jgi:hypothetical protein